MTKAVLTSLSKTNGLLLIAGFASGLWMVAATAAPTVGTSAAVRGEVFVSTGGAQRKARVRDDIKLEDRVLTKDDSALQILLLDRSTFTVGQNCRLTIDKFVYDPETSVGEVSARVTRGAFRFMSGRIGKNNPTNASVSTPSATIGIRGTFFEGIVGEDAVALAGIAGISSPNADLRRASLTVLRGPGTGKNTLDRSGIISVSNSAGSKTLIRPNYAVFVPAPGVAPIGPFKMTGAMQEYLDFFLRSSPNGAPVNPVETLSGEAESGQDKFETPLGDDEPFDDDARPGVEDTNNNQETSR